MSLPPIMSAYLTAGCVGTEGSRNVNLMTPTVVFLAGNSEVSDTPSESKPAFSFPVPKPGTGSQY